MTDLEMEEQTNCDFDFLIRYIDECLVSFGTQSLFDGDKIRDMFLDFRSMVVGMGASNGD